MSGLSLKNKLILLATYTGALLQFIFITSLLVLFFKPFGKAHSAIVGVSAIFGIWISGFVRRRFYIEEIGLRDSDEDE